MDPLTGLFVLALYKATETVWTKVLDKGFDAAWAPVDESLKARFTRWVRKGQKRERGAAPGFRPPAGRAYPGSVRRQAR